MSAFCIPLPFISRRKQRQQQYGLLFLHGFGEFLEGNDAVGFPLYMFYRCRSRTL
jgi:hypothetical protein